MKKENALSMGNGQWNGTSLADGMFSVRKGKKMSANQSKKGAKLRRLQKQKEGRL